MSEVDPMSDRGGNVSSADPAIAVLYTLLRDGDLSPGVLEKAIDGVLNSDATEYVFSNGWLAMYAADVIQRLSPKV